MIEFIVLAILTLVVLGFAGFIYLNSQKQTKVLQEQMKAISEMWMAGSFQEWNRIKTGKRATPNKIKNEPNFKELSEAKRVPFSEITGVIVDNEPRRKIKIYS